jgi:hypothetical protein
MSQIQPNHRDLALRGIAPAGTAAVTLSTGTNWTSFLAATHVADAFNAVAAKIDINGGAAYARVGRTADTNVTDADFGNYSASAPSACHICPANSTTYIYFPEEDPTVSTRPVVQLVGISATTSAQVHFAR